MNSRAWLALLLQERMLIKRTAILNIYTGNTERLSIGSHNSPIIRLHTLASAATPPRTVPYEDSSSMNASDKVSEASDVSTYSNSGNTSPETVDTPLTSSPSSPDAASDKSAPLSLDQETLRARLAELCLAVSESTSIPQVLTVSIRSEIKGAAVKLATSIVDITASLAADRASISSSIRLADKIKASTKVADCGYDADSEDESEESRIETESDYDSASLMGVKDGRWGSRLTTKVRRQTRNRFLKLLRRLCKVEV